jgi:UDP-N-acetylmuramoylalanine-D-glutamate ligase
MREGTEMVRKLLPVHIAPELHNPRTCTADAQELQQSLYLEETQPYQAAVNAVGGELAYLSHDEWQMRKQYAASIYLMALMDLTQTALAPALAAARASRFTLESKRAELIEQLTQRIEVCVQWRMLLCMLVL